MSKNSNLWMGLGALFFANFISGAFNSIFVKLGIKEFPPLTFTMFRFLIASIVLLPFFLRKKDKKSIKSHFGTIFIQSAFFAINVGIFSIAMQYTSAIMSQVIYVLNPVVVGIIGYFVFEEKFTRNKILGSLIALFGVLFLIWQSFLKADILSLGTLRGNLLILCGVFVYSGYLLLSQKLVKFYSPIETSFFTSVITFVLILFASGLESINNPLQVNRLTIVGILSLFGLAILSSAIMYFLIQIGIKHVGAFTSSLFQYVVPFFTMLSASIIIREEVTFSIILGGLLIMFGVFYSTTWQHIKKKINFQR